MAGEKFDSNDYVEIAEGIYWVGFDDDNAGFHCNPYLIVDGDEAVLIDGGSRNDFSTVMLKIMRTGTNPRNITRLIYQHSDPDLCGNLPHMEAFIGREDLKVISHHENNVFIDYYSPKTPKLCIEKLGFSFEFQSGRRLEFALTPFVHTPGNFITYDTKTRTLFSSDLFGSFDVQWSLYSAITERCADCGTKCDCSVTGRQCEIAGLLNFHRRIMPSVKALRYALDKVEAMDASLIAPQHGSVLHTPVARRIAIDRLRSLTSVGFDYFLETNGK